MQYIQRIQLQKFRPAAAAVPPVNAPTSPFSWTFFIAPLARRLPKPVKGTVAPAPAKSTIF